MVDRQFSGHFTPAMSADAIGKHRKQHRRFILCIGHEGSHGITVFIVLARHAGVRLSFDVQMSALSTDHRLGILLLNHLRFRLSWRLIEIKAIDHLPEVDLVSMLQAATLARDRFKIHPGTRHRTMIIKNKDSVIRLFDAGMQRRNGWVIEYAYRLYRV